MGGCSQGLVFFFFFLALYKLASCKVNLNIRFIVHSSCFVSVFCFGFVFFFLQYSNGMEKCLLCSGLKQQNTAVAQPAYVHVRFQLVLLISSVSLLLSKYKFSNVHTDLVFFFSLVWGWLGFLFVYLIFFASDACLIWPALGTYLPASFCGSQSYLNHNPTFFSSLVYKTPRPHNLLVMPPCHLPGSS